MKLLTAEIRRKLPKLYANEALGVDAPIIVKFFDPYGAWTWYASEFDGVDRFYGLVDGFEQELGYFLLSELESIGRIERDMYFGYEHKLRDFMERA